MVTLPDLLYVDLGSGILAWLALREGSAASTISASTA